MDTEMKTYRVQGEVEVVFYIDVEAENEEQAQEIATESFSHTMLACPDEVGDFEVQDIEEV